MYCAAWPVAAVHGSTVPEMTVEDHHRASRGEELNFVWMRCHRVDKNIRRNLAAAMGTRDDAGSAVLGSEVIQQPNRVADLVPVGAYAFAPVSVQALKPLTR